MDKNVPSRKKRTKMRDAEHAAGFPARVRREGSAGDFSRLLVRAGIGWRRAGRGAGGLGATCAGSAIRTAGTTLVIAAGRAVVETIGERLGEFIHGEAFFIGRELLDHVGCHLVCRGWGRALCVASRSTKAAWATLISAAFGAAILFVSACIWTAIGSAAAGTMGTMAAEEFDRLDQFILFQFAVLVCVELFHQLRRHLGGIGWAVLAVRASAGAAFVPAGAGRGGGAGVLRLGVERERG